MLDLALVNNCALNKNFNMNCISLIVRIYVQYQTKDHCTVKSEMEVIILISALFQKSNEIETAVISTLLK